MTASSEAKRPGRGLTPDDVYLGHVRIFVLLLRHTAPLLAMFNERAGAARLLKTRLMIVAFFVFYPLLLLRALWRTREVEPGYWARLRFHAWRPLTYPGLLAGSFNTVDFFRRRLDGEIEFTNSKECWIRLFEEGGVKTPRFALQIERDTPDAAAERLPEADIVVRPNHGATGRRVRIHRFDPQTGKYDGKLSAREVLDRYRRPYTWNRRLDGSSVVTTFVAPSREAPHPDCAQHLRLVTVDNGEGPMLFRAVYFIQFEQGVMTSNVARGAATFEMPDELFEGTTKLPGYDEAKAQALMLHARLPVVSIGWDVILTDDGPYFIEGNIPHGVASVEQVACYDLWTRYYRLTGFVRR